MRTIWYGLSPMLGIAAFIVVVYGFIPWLVQKHEYATDQAAIPYLVSDDYFPRPGCPSAWGPGVTLTTPCLSVHYRILSTAVEKRFHLPERYGRGLGWFRIGRDALDLTCSTKSCDVKHVVYNAFGLGVQFSPG